MRKKILEEEATMQILHKKPEERIKYFSEITDKDYVLIHRTKKSDEFQHVDEGNIIKVWYDLK